MRCNWPWAGNAAVISKKQWKKQLACIVLGLAFGAAAQMQNGAGQDFSQGYRLLRNSYGQGDASYEIYVEGLEDEAVPVEIELSERAYTQEEAYKVYRTIMEELPRYILNDNISLGEVRGNLDLVTNLPQYGVRLKWESDEPELVNSFGEVKNSEVGEEGRGVMLRLRLTEGNWPGEYVVPITVKPPMLTKEEQRRGLFMEMLSQEDKRQVTAEVMELPLEFQGRSLRYHSRTGSSFWPIALLGLAAAVLLAIKEKNDIKKGETERKQQMMLDYSEVLSRLIIFLGAGMSIRTAWDKIAFDHQHMVEAGRRKPRHIYKEMYETSCQMQSGVTERKAFEEFGWRCGLQPYIKLSGLLEQNRKNGSRHLRDTLKLEMAEAFEQRKHQARRLGEEAGTKLLLPLFMLLSVVMIMIAVPALLEFR